ncbi:anthrone oxygenase family protein [Mycobacterium sp. NPDC050441]|uniref:anthrone oxygenase family protein n=1 Tax=Mycobacterium sp. NPDC050441 TaxID=3155403 RepID=UPI00340D7E14
MTISPVVALTAAAALGSAASGGIFYVFSTFVMRGLDRTGPVAAITAMRGMNAEANTNAPFLLFLLGSALLSLAVGVVALTQIGRPGSWFLLAGAIFGVLGVLITMLFNVPLNNHLDQVDLADAAAQWQAYFTTWTAWNHVRTVSGFISAVLLLIGLRYR